MLFYIPLSKLDYRTLRTDNLPSKDMSRQSRATAAATTDRDSTPPPLTMEEQLASFRVSDNYEVDNIVGEGAYGLVW